MNIAGKELSKLCKLASSSVIPTSASTQQGYYHLDTEGVNEHGTSLHRLLATHCRSHAVEKFLHDRDNHIRSIRSKSSGYEGFPSPPPPLLYHQNASGVTALHVAVFRNSSHVESIVHLLLDWEQHQATTNSNNSSESSTNESTPLPSLASLPMKCQSYPLHIVCGQNLTINQHVVQCLLEADPTVVNKEDVNGDTPLSLLWKNTCRFRWAVSIMDGSSTYIEYIKEDESSWMTIISPLQYVRLSKLMILAALERRKQKNKKSDNENCGSHHNDFCYGMSDDDISIHDLCGIPRLPPMILKLTQTPQYNAVLKVQGNARTLDDHGMLPLHHAVQSPPATYEFVPSYIEEKSRRTVVQHLLEEYPGSVYVEDHKGRLPLHYALEFGYLAETDLLTMLRQYPDSLRIQDPATRLFPFMLVAANHLSSIQRKACPCPPLLSTLKKPKENQTNTIGETDLKSMSENEHWKDDHIRMTFHLLQLCPEAIEFQDSSCGTATAVGIGSGATKKICCTVK